MDTYFQKEVFMGDFFHFKVYYVMLQLNPNIMKLEQYLGYIK